ncbi:uncharacterized protein [Amphiura filiformis]|uniref:uncharacterized protein n=1 Tax=Amphiura filiformis TaxID=82378 RepID=UPI003B2235F4
MSDQEKREILTQMLEEHLGKYYTPPCNYLLVQVDPLLQLCDEKYEGHLTQFENKFIKPVAKLLETLRASRLHITFEDTTNGQIYVLLHLTEPKTHKMTPGEVALWVGKRDPGTLSMKYTKYVTERDGTPLPEPYYEETRMKIQEKDIPRCLTKAYFSELRQGLKDKGAERYSIAMRLFVAYNTTTKSMKSLDYDQVLLQRRRRAPKLRERTESGVQESCEDPVAKSTEEQVLRQALSEYRNHRQQHGHSTDRDEYRSSSPTGTEASAYPPTGHGRLTDSSEDDSEDARNGVMDVSLEDKRGRPRSDGSEPEASVTLKKPRDDYVDQGSAVGPNTNQGKEVEPPVARPMDDYI